MAYPQPPSNRNVDRAYERRDTDYQNRQMTEAEFNQYGTGGSFDNILMELATKYRDPRYRTGVGAFTPEQEKYLTDMKVPREKWAQVGGKNGFTQYDYTEALLTDVNYRKQFAKQPGQSQEQWLANLERHFPGMTSVFRESGMGANQRFQDFFNYDSKTVGGESAGDVAARKEREKQIALDAEITAFSDSLKGDISENDPEVQKIMTMVANSAEKQARKQGIQGPMSIANSSQTTAQQLGQYNMDRKRMYGQALGFKTAHELGRGQEAQAAAMQAWQRDAGDAAQRAANDPLPTILGIGGGIIGGVGGAFLGNPVAGAGAGFAFGNGAGKMIVGNGNIPPPPSRKYYGSY